MRILAIIGVVALVAGCRPYDYQSTVSNQDGLIPADQFARYGTDQATAVAIGRALAQWDGGSTPADRTVQVTKAAEYAKTLDGVVSVIPDTLGYRLTVTFASGWRTGIVPIADGKSPTP